MFDYVVVFNGFVVEINLIVANCNHAETIFFAEIANQEWLLISALILLSP